MAILLSYDAGEVLKNWRKTGFDPVGGDVNSDQSGSISRGRSEGVRFSYILLVLRWKILLWSFANFGG